MEKYIYDEKNGLWYELSGDYYIPCIELPEAETRPIGKYGRMRKRYLKEHRRVLYTNLLTSCELWKYLADIEEQAENMFSRLVNEFAEKEGITEALKADNAMEWVQKMNNIRNRAAEVVNAEVIYN